MATERGRITITGFDPTLVEDREPISGWVEETGTETTGRWTQAFWRFVNNRMALLGVLVVLTMALLALFARPFEVLGVTIPGLPSIDALPLYDPGLRGYQPQFERQYGISPSDYEPPSLTHLMGTDGNARDLFSRWLVGGRYSISIGFVVVGITAVVGIAYGAISGYYGGWVDEFMMRLLDIIFAFPGLVLALVIVAMLGGGYWQLVAAFSLFGWAGYGRLIRGEILKVKENEYVMAAKALGARDRSVIFRHIVPNAIAPVIVQASLSIGTVVIGVAALGFLGIGFDATTPEWGTMLDQEQESLQDSDAGPWVTVFPGMGIFLFVMAMNLVGDGINDALGAKEDVSATQGVGG